MLAHIIGHFRERRAGKENLVYALAFHLCRILMCDRPAATTENLDVARAALA